MEWVTRGTETTARELSDHRLLVTWKEPGLQGCRLLLFHPKDEAPEDKETETLAVEVHPLAMTIIDKLAKDEGMSRDEAVEHLLRLGVMEHYMGPDWPLVIFVRNG